MPIFPPLSPLGRRSAPAPAQQGSMPRYVSSRCAEPCRTGRGCHQGCHCDACQGTQRSSRYPAPQGMMPQGVMPQGAMPQGAMPGGYMMPNIVINVQSGNRSSNDYQTFDNHANDEMHYTAPVTAPTDYRSQLVYTPQPQVVLDPNGTPVVVPPKETMPVVATPRAAQAMRLPLPPPDTTPRYYREFP